MESNSLNNEQVTVMFSELIKPGKAKEYENWLEGIQEDLKQFQGFVEINVIKPSDPHSLEYISLVKFDSQDNLIKWRESSVLAKWLSQLHDLVSEPATIQQAYGLELWFSRPKVFITAESPAFWKQVLLGVATVYPMILLLNFVLEPVTGDLPWLLSLFINVVLLSSLLTYPIMPYVTKYLQNWLYPNR